MQTKKAPSEKKGRLRIAALILLIGAAAVLFCARNGMVDGLLPQSEPPPEPTRSVDFRTDRALRETTYAADLAALQALVDGAQTDEQTRKDAAARVQSMVDAHRVELNIGAALEAAGYSPALTLCQSGSLTIMLAQTKLSDAQSAEILSLCASHVDFGLENIRIATGAS